LAESTSGGNCAVRDPIRFQSPLQREQAIADSWSRHRAWPETETDPTSLQDLLAATRCLAVADRTRRRTEVDEATRARRSRRSAAHWQWQISSRPRAFPRTRNQEQGFRRVE